MSARFLTAVVVTAALFLSAATASALAAEFESNLASGNVLAHSGVWNNANKNYGGEAAEEQIFSVTYSTAKHMDIECTSVSGKGTFNKAQTKTQAIAVEYQGCVIAGTDANDFTAEYELNAGANLVAPWEGTVTILKPITIGAKNGTCTVTVPEQGPLTGITYSQLASGPEGNASLKVAADITGGIEWSATGVLASCNGTGSKVGTGKPGEYIGNSTTWVQGGTFKII